MLLFFFVRSKAESSCDETFCFARNQHSLMIQNSRLKVVTNGFTGPLGLLSSATHVRLSFSFQWGRSCSSRFRVETNSVILWIVVSAGEREDFSKNKNSMREEFLFLETLLVIVSWERSSKNFTSDATSLLAHVQQGSKPRLGLVVCGTLV